MDENARKEKLRAKLQRKYEAELAVEKQAELAFEQQKQALVTRLEQESLEMSKRKDTEFQYFLRALWSASKIPEHRKPTYAAFKIQRVWRNYKASLVMSDEAKESFKQAAAEYAEKIKQFQDEYGIEGLDHSVPTEKESEDEEI